MKRIAHIFAVLVICCALPVFGETSVWQHFSSGKCNWVSESYDVPLSLTSTPVSADGCDVTGRFSGSVSIDLEGEAWPEGDEVRMKLKGRISDETKVMFYGTVSSLDDEAVWYEGTFSLTFNGRGREQSFCCRLADTAAQERREAKEREEAEARWKASPEFKLKSKLEELIASNRVGNVEKKSVNLGSAVSSVANGDASGISSSVDIKQKIEALDAAGEVKKCNVTKDPLSATLKFKDKTSLTANFDVIGTFELLPSLFVSVVYSSDLSDVLYLIRGEEKSAILLHQDKLYNLGKNAAMDANYVTTNDYLDFIREFYRRKR